MSQQNLEARISESVQKGMEKALSPMSKLLSEKSLLKPVNFRVTVPLLTQATIVKTILYEGPIREIIAHWPDGCNGLVWIRVFAGNAQIWPVGDLAAGDNWVALNNATERFTISKGDISKSQHEYLNHREPLTVIINNGDNQHPHTPSVIVLIEAVLP